MILKKTLIATISALLLCGCANSYLGFQYIEGNVDTYFQRKQDQNSSQVRFYIMAGAGIGVAACAAADSDNVLACVTAGFSGCAEYDN